MPFIYALYLCPLFIYLFIYSSLDREFLPSFLSFFLSFFLYLFISLKFTVTMTGRRLYHSSYSRYFVISSYLGHSTIKLPCLRILLMPRVPKGAWGEKLPAPPGLVDRPRALGFLPALRVTQAGTGILLSHFPSWRMLSWRGTAIVFA